MKKVFIAIALLFFVQYTHAQSKRIDSLKQLLSQVKQDTSTFNILQVISWNCMYTYSDTALIYAQKALLVSKKLREPQLQADALLLCGHAYGVTGDNSNAIDYLLNGLHIEE